MISTALFIVTVGLGYLLGSVSGSLTLGRLRGVDIRTMGSGNAGGTNALRTQGWWFAIGVVVIDIGKGWLAAAVLPGLLLSAGTQAGSWLAPASGAAAVIGHVYPLWHGFRGGKGAGTLIGAVAALMPMALIPVLLVWLALVTATGYVGLATMFAASALPLYVLVDGGNARTPLLVFAVLMAVLVVYAHRSNIARLRAGNENRMERLMLRRPPTAPR